MKSAFTISVVDCEKPGPARAVPTKHFSIVWPDEVRWNSTFIVGVSLKADVKAVATEFLETLVALGVISIRLSFGPKIVLGGESLYGLINPIIERDRVVAAQLDKLESSP